MMAEAYGKATGRPGICFVTRGPGATNAAAGIHVASQDSTPLILFVGQVERRFLGREAVQELDYPAVFGSMTKWAAQIDNAVRIAEFVGRAFHPGPVGPSRPGGAGPAARHAGPARRLPRRRDIEAARNRAARRHGGAGRFAGTRRARCF